MKKVNTTSKKIHTFTAIDAKCGATGMEYGVASLLRQGVDRSRAVDRKLCPPCGSAEPGHARPAPGLAGELLLELGRIWRAEPCTRVGDVENVPATAYDGRR